MICGLLDDEALHVLRAPDHARARRVRRIRVGLVRGYSVLADH